MRISDWSSDVCSSDRTPPPPPIHTDYSITRDVVFSPPGWPQSLKADIYQPNGTGPFPAVLVLYGGGWEHGDRKQLSSIAKDLARRGYVAVDRKSTRLTFSHSCAARNQSSASKTK